MIVWENNLTNHVTNSCIQHGFSWFYEIQIGPYQIMNLFLFFYKFQVIILPNNKANHFTNTQNLYIAPEYLNAITHALNQFLNATVLKFLTS